MRVLYTTDLHGIKWKYEAIFSLVDSLNLDLVINGGDMFPIKPSFMEQDLFIQNFLEYYFSKFEDRKVFYLCYPGNDDLMMFDELFENICRKFYYIRNIAQRRFENNGYEFIGMNWITDTPFGLKDRCRMDHEKFIFPKTLGSPVLSTPKGLIKIKDWYAYAESLPTIEDELNNLIRPKSPEKTIYVFHMPPANLKLDICSDGSEVGSQSLFNFISKRPQPMITLHGHIHESPNISGVWKCKLDQTYCIQPGQSHYYEDHVIYVVLDLKEKIFQREKIIK
jgi:Icc-related predicted phosphoesterase